MKLVSIILISFLLCSCIEMTSINIKQEPDGQIEFFVKKSGLLIKSTRPISWLEVYYDKSADERIKLWSINSNETELKEGEAPTPEGIVYGVVPDKFVEAVPARSLQHGIKYSVFVSGFGYGATGTFSLEK